MRLVRGIDEEVWRRERFALVVATARVHEFGRGPALRAFLPGTGGRVLVEASPVDRIWGIGLSADAGRAPDPALRRGPTPLDSP
ncbi:NADAR domain-containing protein [Streptomyces tremellae]|uniref:NADAR domain-containing protein n=1 Tax=Streptomyces tremellae TaxID=1124239 RepID=A0ABP7FNP3_9ACTN